jgi:hypothetical protein
MSVLKAMWVTGRTVFQSICLIVMLIMALVAGVYTLYNLASEIFKAIYNVLPSGHYKPATQRDGLSYYEPY